MPNDIIMPQMGADMTQGKVVRWLKQVGDEIRAGEIIAEIETDKATVEYEAYDSGILKQIVVPEGETVPVGTTIALLGAPGEEIPAAQPAAGGAPTARAPAEPAPAAPGQAAAVDQPAASVPPAPDGQAAAGAPGQAAASQGPRQPAGPAPQPMPAATAPPPQTGADQPVPATGPGGQAVNPAAPGATAAPGQGEGGEAPAAGAGLQEATTAGRDGNPLADQPRAAQQEPVSPPGHGLPSVDGLDGGGRVAPAVPAQPTQAAPPQGDPGEPGGRIFATPIARRLAEERGIDLRQIQGTGPNGRILKEDIEEYLAASGAAPVTTGVRADLGAAAAPPPAPPAPPPPAVQPTPAPVAPAPAAPARQPGGGPPFEVVELNRIRQTAARRTQQSKQTAPHFYVTVKVDMGAAVALRQQLNAVPGLPSKISYNDLVIKAAAQALRKHPQINASFDEGKLRVYQTVNIGVAVGLPDGLINVVLTGVENRSVLDIAQTTKGLYERARAGKLRAEEYTGATFTISNLGMYDVEQFAAVISPPEGAILAVASVIREPVVDGDQIRIGDLMRLTLSADHRVTDGVRATEFLSDLRGFLEQPAGLLL